MQIDVNSVSELFKAHYEEPSNDRILFSGRFGSGKSYFLKKYFENKESSTFWIQPVSYSVSSNENIFEYIKFDLVLKLLKYYNTISDGKLQFDDKLIAQQYLIYHPLEAAAKLADLLGIFSEKAKLIGESVSKILDLDKNFKNFKEVHNKKSDKEKVIDFLNSISTTKGSIYEDDIITQIIREGINILKKQTNEKITLIVDDLDRLDPEHIFRLLNIFSIHNDYYTSSNKFDFDRIILVCDYDNIQKTFEHRYGSGVDFEGYIDKFYTNDIFRFDNESALLFFCDSYISPLINDDNTIFLLKIILKELVIQGKLTVRSIIKSKYFFEQMNNDFFEPFEIIRTSINVGNPFPNHHTIVYTNIKDVLDHKNSEFYINSRELKILSMIKLLSIMCGDFERLKVYVNELIKTNSNSYDYSVDNNTSIFKSLFLITNIIDNFDDEISIFFDTTSMSPSKSLASPKVRLFNLYLPIVLDWSFKNKYDGSVSYFNNSKLQFDNNAYEQMKKPIKIGEIFSLIQKVLSFLEDNNLHYKLGMTGR